MGRIFYIMGKSASGKDTMYRMIKERLPQLKPVVSYTTRPIRRGETEGGEYHFCTVEQMRRLETEGRIIEARVYHTVCGLWNYFTVDDGQIDLNQFDYLMIGTLESYEKIRRYFGKEKLVPLYLYVEDGLRLQRALDREKKQKSPNYRELCRRYLADEEDFSEENMHRCGIERRYDNGDLDQCLSQVLVDINRLQSIGYL